MAMTTVTGSPLWKVLRWLGLAFLVITTVSQLWNMSDTWFLITFLQQLWDYAVTFIGWVRT